MQPWRKGYAAKAAIFTLVGLPWVSVANDLTLKPSVDIGVNHYETKQNDETELNRIFTAVPKLNASYSSKKFKGEVFFKNTFIYRTKSQQSHDDSFFESRYSGTLNLWDKALDLSVNGSQRHVNSGSRDSLISDPLLGDSDQVKSRNNRVSLRFTNPGQKLVKVSLLGSLSKVETERRVDSNQNFDNDTYKIQSLIEQGKNISHVTWNIRSELSNTNRRGVQDLKSRRINGRFGVNIGDSAQIIATHRRDEYELDTGNTDFDTIIYGAGLALLGRSNNRIDLTYNRLEESGKEEYFVGGAIDWQFSERSRIDIDYSKRFFGNDIRFNFAYNLKHFRFVSTYSEQVTTYAQLEAGEQTGGIFVCQLGSTALADCFQPSSLSYQLQEGEEFRNFVFFDNEITQEALLRRNGIITLGYQRNRLSLSSSLTFTETEFLESNRQSQTRRANVRFGFKFSEKSTLSSNLSYTERQTASATAPEDDIIDGRVSFSRKFGRNIHAELEYRYRDRRTSGKKNYEDNRLSFNLTYKFN